MDYPGAWDLMTTEELQLGTLKSQGAEVSQSVGTTIGMNGDSAVQTYSAGRHLGVEYEVPLWTTEGSDDDPQVTTHRTWITTLGEAGA